MAPCERPVGWHPDSDEAPNSGSRLNAVFLLQEILCVNADSVVLYILPELDFLALCERRLWFRAAQCGLELRCRCGQVAQYDQELQYRCGQVAQYGRELRCRCGQAVQCDRELQYRCGQAVQCDLELQFRCGRDHCSDQYWKHRCLKMSLALQSVRFLLLIHNALRKLFLFRCLNRCSGSNYGVRSNMSCCRNCCNSNLFLSSIQDRKSVV